METQTNPNAMVLHYIGVINGIKYWIANYMTY